MTPKARTSFAAREETDGGKFFQFHYYQWHPLQNALAFPAVF